MEGCASESRPVPAGDAGWINELCEEYQRYALRVRSTAPETAEEELLYLKRLFVWCGPPGSAAELFAGLGPKQLAAFLVEYAETHGPGSRRWMQHSLRMFLRFAWQASYAARDLSGLVPSVRRPRHGNVPRALPQECIDGLLTGIERETPAGLRDAAIVGLLAMYGVRGVQLRRLRLVDIDWAEDRIRFPAAKGGRAIEQHLTPDAGNRLVDYLERGRPASAHPEVFLTLTPPFRPLPCASYLSAMLRRRLEQLGLETPTGVSRGAHGFRHAFATRLTGRVPFKDVADLLGHRDPSSTLIYGKVDLAGLRQAALPWPGGEG